MTGNGRRRLVLLLGGLALVAVLVLVLLPLLLPGDRVRELAAERLADATGGEVTLGEASVRVLPRLAVRLGGGRLRGSGEQLAARQGQDFGLVRYDASIDRVEVQVSLGALLRRRIEVDGVTVACDELLLERADDRIVAEQAVLHVDDLALGVPSARPAGTGPQPPGALIPPDLTARADLRVGRLTVGGAAYRDVHAAAEMDGRLLTADTVTLRRAGGTVRGRAELDWEQDPWGELIFSWDATGVPAGALLAPWAPDLAQRLDTVLNSRGSGRCGVRDGDTARATLSLTGRADAGEGVLHAGDWLREVRPYLGARQDLVDVRFHALEHTFRVEQGRYLVEDLRLQGLDTDWEIHGWVTLDGVLDLSVGVLLPPGFTPDLGSLSFLADAVRDDAGRVRLDLRLTGPGDRPDVALDLTQLKEAAANNSGEVLKQGLGGLLDKWKTK